MTVAHKCRITYSKVFIERQMPQRLTVTVDYDGPAVHHALNDLPGPVLSVNAKRDRSLIISVAGPYDSYGETFFPVFFHKEMLARDLVSGIFPVRVGQCCAFSDDIACGRLVVGRSRTYIDILLCNVLKEPVIALNLIYGKSDEFTYHIKSHIADCLDNSIFIVNVTNYLVDIFRYGICPVASVDEPYFP